jgi:hypothetical protein
MKRPTGVTVIVIVNLVVTFAWFAVEAVLSREPSTGGWLMILVAAFFFVVLSIALLKLQNWARWTSIVFYVLSLIRIPVRVLTAGGDLFQITGVSLAAAFVAWAVWCLFRANVKAAFGEA